MTSWTKASLKRCAIGVAFSSDMLSLYAGHPAFFEPTFEGDHAGPREVLRELGGGSSKVGPQLFKQEGLLHLRQTLPREPWYSRQILG